MQIYRFGAPVALVCLALSPGLQVEHVTVCSSAVLCHATILQHVRSGEACLHGSGHFWEACTG